jgi:hypothetical protein
MVNFYDVYIFNCKIFYIVPLPKDLDNTFEKATLRRCMCVCIYIW